MNLHRSIIAEVTQAATKPLLPENEKMGPWISQYRWWIRKNLREHGAEPIGIQVYDIKSKDRTKITGILIFESDPIAIPGSQN